MRLALTGGGTGGHILPALAVMEAVQARTGGGTTVRWFGPEDRGERARIEAAGLAFEPVAAAAVRGRGPLALARSFTRLGGGTISAMRRLRGFKPDVVLSTGGYGSFPCSLAARALRRPLVVYLPDVEPGWAVKAEKRLATRMATTTEAALAFLPRQKTSVTGYPVRKDFFELSREQARAQLGIPQGAKVVVVAGATQGAKAINDAVFRGLRSLVEDAWVYHVTGAAQADDAAGYESGLGADLAARYFPAPFREDLPAVMVASDVGVFRAGASVLGEVPAAGLPSILVPAAYAGGHQMSNARWLADGGAAVIVEESQLATLVERILRLVEDEPTLGRMRAAAQTLARPGAAGAIADLVLEVARK